MTKMECAPVEKLPLESIQISNRVKRLAFEAIDSPIHLNRHRTQENHELCHSI